MKHLFFGLLLGEAGSSTLNPFDLIQQAGWVVKAVMLLLLIASFISWTIIFWKLFLVKKAEEDCHKFIESFWAAGTLEGATRASKAFPKAPLTRVFEAGLEEFNQVTALKLKREDTVELLETNVSRTLTKVANMELSGLQRYIPFLASTAGTAPFVGLFGTVWGIMTSFINIGATGASNLAVVAPGIAEALIATAMGLFAAIPAVLFYNYFISQIRNLGASMQHFSSDFMNTAKRSL